MSEQPKQYVSVNEKEFGNKDSLGLTDLGKALDHNIRDKVLAKIGEVNKKLDADYDVSTLDKGKYSISESQKPQLIAQLKSIVEGLNGEISRMVQEYGDTASLHLTEIQTELASFLNGKNLSFHKDSSAIEALMSISKGLGNKNGEIVNSPLI